MHHFSFSSCERFCQANTRLENLKSNTAQKTPPPEAHCTRWWHTHTHTHGGDHHRHQQFSKRNLNSRLTPTIPLWCEHWNPTNTGNGGEKRASHWEPAEATAQGPRAAGLTTVKGFRDWHKTITLQKHQPPTHTGWQHFPGGLGEKTKLAKETHPRQVQTWLVTKTDQWWEGKQPGRGGQRLGGTQPAAQATPPTGQGGEEARQ